MAWVHSILGFLAPVASSQVIWFTMFGGVRKERGSWGGFHQYFRKFVLIWAQNYNVI